MNIILSRKGFDSSYGGFPSPVLPGLGPVSFPIPSRTGAPAAEYSVGGQPLASLLSDLTGARHDGRTWVHLDPDLDASSHKRQPGWLPALGQLDAAQTHLANYSVGPGHLFLFFGWFRPAERSNGHWQYVRGSDSFHALFGWLQVGAVVDVDAQEGRRMPEWLMEHPHVQHCARLKGRRNAVYVATERLHLAGASMNLQGGGVFRRWSEALKLTANGASRSVWSVPLWMAPAKGRKPLSYHGKPTRWELRPDHVRLNSVARGQEFVLDCRDYPEADSWAKDLIERHA